MYPDAPGALLQTDINLIVRAGEVEKHGNMGNDPSLDHTSKSIDLVFSITIPY